MFKFTHLIFAAAAFAAAPQIASAQAVGDWVLGNFQGAGYWFPGIVESVSARGITVAYDDGDRETLPASSVRAFDWQVGSSIECNFKAAGDWHAATITAVKRGSAEITVVYEDKEKENTTTALCRSHLQR